MRFRPKYLALLLMVPLLMANDGGCSPKPTSSDVQRERQERMVAEGIAQVNVPGMKNFRELKLLKDIYEMRDQEGLVTYTYQKSEQTGKLIFFCDSIGFPIPYATQFSAPESMQRYRVKNDGSSDTFGTARLPQAEPNGLFIPTSADGTWVMCQDPNPGGKVGPVYSEPKVVTTFYRLPKGHPSLEKE